MTDAVTSNEQGPDGFTLDALIANAERTCFFAAAETDAILRALKELRVLRACGMRQLQDVIDIAKTVHAVETTAPRVLSATEKLHNICEALSEQADESPFTREEWDAVDKQTVRLTNALRGLIEAVRSIEIDKVSWDTSVAKPLATAYLAIKHQDPAPESAMKSTADAPLSIAKGDPLT